LGRDADGFLATKALGLVSLDTSPFCIAKYPVQQSGSDLVGFVGHVSSVLGASGQFARCAIVARMLSRDGWVSG
jgi:hypothetical protein